MDSKISVRRNDAKARPATCRPVTVAAIGDLMLAGEWNDIRSEGAASEAFRDVAGICVGDDLIFANLETTTEGGDGFIATEPRLIALPESLVVALRALHVDVACLANNHTFDARRGGFLRVRKILEQAGIGYLGAGLSAAEAARPLIVERRGLR